MFLKVIGYSFGALVLCCAIALVVINVISIIKTLKKRKNNQHKS